jgi:hypothetical protein
VYITQQDAPRKDKKKKKYCLQPGRMVSVQGSYSDPPEYGVLKGYYTDDVGLMLYAFNLTVYIGQMSNMTQPGLDIVQYCKAALAVGMSGSASPGIPYPSTLHFIPLFLNSLVHFRS